MRNGYKTLRNSIRSISEGLSRLVKAKRVRSKRRRRNKTSWTSKKVRKKLTSKSSKNKASNAFRAKRRRTVQQQKQASPSTIVSNKFNGKVQRAPFKAIQAG